MRRFAVTVPVLLVVLLVFASAAATQPAPRVARVGMLCNPLCDVSFNDAFLDELRKFGWVEGTTIAIERKDPDYRLDQLPALAAAILALGAVYWLVRDQGQPREIIAAGDG